jgi:hypothetical protein
MKNAIRSRTAGEYGLGSEAQERRPNSDDIARLAYSYWEERGRQAGSSEQDWFRAEQELMRRSSAI